MHNNYYILNLTKQESFTPAEPSVSSTALSFFDSFSRLPLRVCRLMIFTMYLNYFPSLYYLCWHDVMDNGELEKESKKLSAVEETEGSAG